MAQDKQRQPQRLKSHEQDLTTPASRSGWPCLPNEIRIMILGHLTTSNGAYNINYATTCREWQRWFELDTFRSIHLDQHKLTDMQSIMERYDHRIPSVDKISLVVKLPEYDCSVCMKQEDDETRLTNDQIFFRAVTTLCNILSSWAPQGRKNMCLELGAWSPSDAQHGFREYRFRKDCQIQGPRARWLYRQHLVEVRDATDFCPCWAAVRRGAAAPFAAKRRVLSTLMDPALGNYPVLLGHSPRNHHGWFHFPKVDLVSTVQVRRYGYRRIALEFIRELANGLPNLTTLRLERWHHFIDPFPTPGAMGTIDSLISAGLENLSVFCDYGEPINQEARRNNGVRLQVLEGYQMPTHIVYTVQHLRHVSLSFVIEAHDFFRAALRMRTNMGAGTNCFQNLESLILTCGLFCSRDSGALTVTLVRASDALFMMPKLKTATVWNGGRSWGSYLHWGNTKDSNGLEQPSITYASSQNRSTHAVIQAWKTSFERNRPGQGSLVGIEKKLDRTGLFCAADMLGRLPKSSFVLSQESKAEMQLEGTARNAFERIGWDRRSQMYRHWQ